MGMFAGRGIPSLTTKVQERVTNPKVQNKIDVHISLSPIISKYKNFSLKNLENSIPKLGKTIGEEIEKKLKEIKKTERRMSFG